MTAIVARQTNPVEMEKIYDERDVNLALCNIGVFSIAYLASKVLNPYAQTLFSAGSFIFMGSKHLQTFKMIPRFRSVERTLAHPLIVLGSIWSPTCARMTSVGLMLSVARNGYSKLYNYFKSPHKDPDQSAIAGTLLHGFNTGCQIYWTKETFDQLEMPNPAKDAAEELGVNPNRKCDDAVKLNRWEEAQSIPKTVLDACKSTCRNLQKKYYKQMVELRDCKTPDCTDTQQKINELQEIARLGYGCAATKNRG